MLTTLAFGVWNVALGQHPLLYWLAHATMSAVYPIALAFMTARYLFDAKSIGIRWDIGGRVRPLLLVALCIGLLALSLVLYHTTIPLAAWLVPENALYFDTVFGEMMPRRGVWGWVYFVYAVLASGVTEELTRVSSRPLFGDSARGKVGYVLFSTTLFASLHIFGGLHQIIPAFFFGLVYGALFVRIRNIIPLVAGHLLMNASLMLF